VRCLFSFFGLLLLSPLLLALLLFPQGCSHQGTSTNSLSGAPHLRVRLLEDVDRVSLATDANPRASIDALATEKTLGFPKNTAVPIYLSANTWHIGALTMGSGILVIRPGSSNGMRINNAPYRGAFRMIPLGPDKFDVINDVEIDDYLKGVVTKEMFSNWPIEALKAQAVIARTYALYSARTGGMSRYWDVYADTRDQVYGGIDGETSGAIEAVDKTRGIVLTYGPGEGKIFKTYFSSCCGGVSAAAFDAFPGEPYVQPLSEQFRGTCCSASKYFNWGPIVIRKDELAKRFHAWADHRAKILGHDIPEAKIAGVYRIDLDKVNRYGRPQRILVTDTNGVQYSWPAEQIRSAVNQNANGGPTLPSSFCKINGDPNSDSITFYDGHGFGHGVGMCQYCAQAQAAQGERAEQILVQAYPGANLVRGY
jgi:stage II sporulation protein D